jgi:hypothetical protein
MSALPGIGYLSRRSGALVSSLFLAPPIEFAELSRLTLPETTSRGGCAGEISLVYFLKRLSKAARASVGREVEVSRSTVTRGMKKLHSFRLSFRGMRAVMGCVHSNRLEVSKFAHCLQQCNSKPHCGHFPAYWMVAGRTTPQFEHLAKERFPGIFGVRGPSRSLGGVGRLCSDRSPRLESW